MFVNPCLSLTLTITAIQMRKCSRDNTLAQTCPVFSYSGPSWQPGLLLASLRFLKAISPGFDITVFLNNWARVETKLLVFISLENWVIFVHLYPCRFSKTPCILNSTGWFFWLFRPKKWLSVRLHCKSHQKSSKCQIFQWVWHFRAEQ